MNRLAKKAIATLLAMNVMITSGFNGEIDSSVRALAAENTAAVEKQSDVQDEVVEKSQNEDEVTAKTVSSCAISVNNLKLNVEYDTSNKITAITDKAGDNEGASVVCASGENLLNNVVTTVQNSLNNKEIATTEKTTISLNGVKSFTTNATKVSEIDTLSKALIQKSEEVVFASGVTIDAQIAPEVKNITFKGKVSVSSGKIGFTKAGTVKILSENSDNTIAVSGFSKCTISKLQVSSTGNGSVKLSKNAFTGCTITDAEFSGKITLTEGAITNTTITNWYLNGVNCSNSSSKPYVNSDKSSKTTVYIVGGELISNSSEKITLQTMVSNWFSGYTNKNIVTSTPSITYTNNLMSGNLAGTNALVRTDYRNEDATIDFSNALIVTNTLQENVANKLGVSKSNTLTWTSDVKANTINNYRVWKENNTTSAFNYNNKKYGLVSSRSEKLTSGKYNYLIEANGMLTPITICVDDVEKLKIVSTANVNNGNIIYLKAEDYLGEADYMVYAHYQYSGDVLINHSDVNVPISKAEAPKNATTFNDKQVVVRIKNRDNITGILILRGISTERKVTSYSVSTRNNSFYIGETIYAKDLEVYNVCYNYSATPEAADITKACTFLVNGKQVASVTLNEVGEKSLTVVYDGCQIDNAVKVYVTSEAIVQMSVVSYEGKAVEGATVNTSDFKIRFLYNSGKVVDINTPENVVYLKDVTVSPNKLVVGKNIITLQYRDCKTEYTIEVPASTIAPTNMIIATATPTLKPVITGTAIATTTPVIIATSSPVVPDGGAKVTATPKATAKVTVTPTPTVELGKTYKLNGVKYKVTAIATGYGKVTVVGYDPLAKKVVYKNSITILNYKFRVSSIANGAFKGCKQLKGTISIGNDVKSIGNNAFMNCKNITSVTLGKGLKSIGKKAFYNCKKLGVVNFRNAKSLKAIGKDAFKKIKSNPKFRVKCNIQRIVKLMEGNY